MSTPVKFVAKAQIEIPLPAGVTTMHLGFAASNRVRFSFEYDAMRPEEADGLLRDYIGKVGESLREASNKDTKGGA